MTHTHFAAADTAHETDDAAEFALAGFDVIGVLTVEEACEFGRASGEELLAQRPEASAAQLLRATLFLRSFAEVLEERRGARRP